MITQNLSAGSGSLTVRGGEHHLDALERHHLLTGLSPESAPSQGRHSFSETSIRDHIADAGFLDNIEDIELKAQVLSQVEQHARVHGGFVNSYGKEKLAAAGFSKGEIEDVSQVLRNREGFGSLKGGGQAWTRLMEAIGDGDVKKGERRAAITGAALTISVAFGAAAYKYHEPARQALNAVFTDIHNREAIFAMASRVDSATRQRVSTKLQAAKNEAINSRDTLDIFGPGARWVASLSTLCVAIKEFNDMVQSVRNID